jgi:hypothetical protein
MLAGARQSPRKIQRQQEFSKGIHMATYDKAWSETTKEPTTKAEFYQFAGITPELEEFISNFVRRPEILDSLSQEKQQEIEAQMDAVLALLC